jgi:hypothetical protein
MNGIRLKLSAAAVRFLRQAVEAYLCVPAGDYTTLLEQGILAALLRRKAALFAWPKEVNTVSLRVEEAAAVHRLASSIYGAGYDVQIRSLACQFMMAIGPKLMMNHYTLTINH